VPSKVHLPFVVAGVCLSADGAVPNSSAGASVAFPLFSARTQGPMIFGFPRAAVLTTI